ncbi:MAG: pirin family protein [Burkholderiaceae bacterium]|jgi:quercetin 2,3-dioxygenase|nr:pirin family protein [Burkholderiaceae bacterium]
MVQVRYSGDRGQADRGWLKTFHSFSFADYHDPQFMGWGNLRVINEDRVAPGKGFGAHSHQDMEIVTYVLSGELAHKDSLGNIETIPPGDIQRMSAGHGVTHSEFNHSQDSETHLLQIWIEPSRHGIAPEYEQKSIDQQAKRGTLLCVASPVGADGLVSIHADASIYAGLFEPNEQARLELGPNRKAYVHLIRGTLTVNGVALSGGDALMLADEPMLRLSQGQGAEALVFDLAP